MLYETTSLGLLCVAQIGYGLLLLPRGQWMCDRLRQLTAAIHDRTKDLILAKRFTWAQHQKLKHWYCTSLLRECFHTWRHGHWHCTSSEFLTWPQHCHFRAASLLSRHRWFCRQVVPAVRAGDCAYYERLAQQAGDADGSGCPKALWQAIKAVLPKQKIKRQAYRNCNLLIEPYRSTLMGWRQEKRSTTRSCFSNVRHTKAVRLRMCLCPCRLATCHPGWKLKVAPQDPS